MISDEDIQKTFGVKPRDSKVVIQLPENEELPPDIVKTLEKLPPLNNLRMFARVPRTFHTIMKLIDQLFNYGMMDKRLRECMYVRISYVCGLYYELRHNILFSENLGMTRAEIEVLTKRGEVSELDEEANLVCKAAEEITKNITLGDETLKKLIDHFGTDTTAELVLLVSWFNMLIRYVESMRVPYEDNPREIITGAHPMKLEQD